MKKKTIVWIVCATVMIVTVVASLFIALWDYQQSIEMDDKLGAAMTPGVWLTLTIPVLFVEYDVFRIISYFISEKQKRKTYKSVLNLSAAAVIAATAITILFICSDIQNPGAETEEIIPFVFGVLVVLIGLYFVIKLVHLTVYAVNKLKEK